MKTKIHPLFIALALLALPTLDHQLSTCFAQGSLTPPGPPGPTMVTLSQIEPRTAITNTRSLVTISQPGSYYLTDNISVSAGDAIDITASGVTLDLNGFTLASTEAIPTGTGISLAGGNTDITIFNGHIKGGITVSGGVYSGSGFANGIFYSGPAPLNVLVSHVSVSGCLTYGIAIGTVSAVIESCSVQTIGSYGLLAASVSHSVAYQCGSYAIIANSVSDCCGFATFAGYGLYTTAAHNCYGHTDGGGVGLYAYTASDCNGDSAGFGTGLNAANTAIGCYGSSVSGTGLYAYAANNCFAQTTAAGGLAPPPALSCVIANNCTGVNNSSGYGLFASQIAIGCYGVNNGSFGSSGLYATIANSCAGTGVQSSYHYNMPP